MPTPQPPARDAFEFLAAMSPLQLVLLGLFAATWLIGANILGVLHYRRMGKSPWSGFKPFAFPWKDFNAKEWLTLLALAVVSLTFGAIALSLGGTRTWPNRPLHPTRDAEPNGRRETAPSGPRG